MTGELGALRAPRRTGAEPFHRGGEPLGFELADFWAWSVSDLVSNTTRGRLAEYIVARALGISTAGVRAEWDPFDLETPSGIRIEVKSAAYLQTWYQPRLSSIAFSAPATRAWDAETNVWSTEVKRQADVYVFALLLHQDKATLDPLDVAQWQFFVLPTTVLDAHLPGQRSIGIARVQGLCKDCVGFGELAAAVEQAGADRAPR